MKTKAIAQSDSEGMEHDSRLVLTLDAGGTNFLFSAVRGNKEAMAPIRLSPNSDDLEKCINTLIEGFERVIAQSDEKPVAISFAFPGPANYPQGIIGDLPNLPAFRGGIPLGPILENHFQLPVFINNDGNLFAYGEALCGFLPATNAALKKAGNPRQYRNLIGITLGTGFGVGVVCNGQLIIGDNSNGGEGWLFRNLLRPECNVEAHLSREGIRRNYAEKAGIGLTSVGTPFSIYEIAKGKEEGNRAAALEVFQEFGTVLGEAIANLLTVIDGLIVLGGGISAAYDLFAPAMFAQLNSGFSPFNGEPLKRVIPSVYDLEQESGSASFLTSNFTEIKVQNSPKRVYYDAEPKTGIGLSKLGASQMIAIGAYAYALQQL